MLKLEESQEAFKMKQIDSLWGVLEVNIDGIKMYDPVTSNMSLMKKHKMLYSNSSFFPKTCTCT